MIRKDNKIRFNASRKYMNIESCLIKELQISKQVAKKILKNATITIDENFKITKKIVPTKSCIEIIFADEDDTTLPIKGNLEIIYEDSNVLVINKSPGVSVYSSDENQITLANKVRFYFNEIGLKTKIRFANRLDFNTSGVVIIAKNPYAHSFLQKQIESRLVKKKYVAFVVGELKIIKNKLDWKISKTCDDNKRYFITENGDIAITIIDDYKSNEFYSRVNVEILTGRTHQIRVHLNELGFPILGDDLYGDSSNLIQRQALHAEKYSLKIPFKGTLTFSAKWPNDLLVLENGLN